MIADITVISDQLLVISKEGIFKLSLNSLSIGRKRW